MFHRKNNIDFPITRMRVPPPPARIHSTVANIYGSLDLFIMRNPPWHRLQPAVEKYLKNKYDNQPTISIPKEGMEMILDLDITTTHKSAPVSLLFFGALYLNLETLVELVNYFESQYEPGARRPEIRRALHELNYCIATHRNAAMMRSDRYDARSHYVEIHGAAHSEDTFIAAKMRLRLLQKSSCKKYWRRAHNLTAIFNSADTVENCLKLYDKIKEAESLSFNPIYKADSCLSYFFCRGKYVYKNDIRTLLNRAQERVVELVKTYKDTQLALDHHLFDAAHLKYGIQSRCREKIVILSDDLSAPSWPPLPRYSIT